MSHRLSSEATLWTRGMTTCAGRRLVADDSDRMRVASGVQTGIAAPAIRLEWRFRVPRCRAESPADCTAETSGIRRNRTRPKPRPSFSTAITTMALPAVSLPLAPSSGASDIGFVNLDLSMEAIAAGANHCPAQLVQPSPGRLVAAQPQHTLQTERADAVLLAGDEPHRKEPRPKWFAGVLEDRAGRQRHLSATGPTAKQATRHFRTVQLLPHKPDRQSRPPIAGGAGTFGMPLHCRTKPRTPETSGDNQSRPVGRSHRSCPHAICWGQMCERDTKFLEKPRDRLATSRKLMVASGTASSVQVARQGAVVVRA